MIALSYSSMKDAECPFRFHVLKIAKSYKEPETDAMRVGSAVHDLIAGYLDHCAEAKLESDLAWFDSVRFEDAPDPERCAELVNTFKGSEFCRIPAGARNIQIETKFELGKDTALLVAEGREWAFKKQTAFRGIVDYAYLAEDQTAYVIDWKTGFRDSDQLQLDIYAYWVLQSLTTKSIFPNRIVTVVANLATGHRQVKEFLTPWQFEPITKLIIDKVREVNSWTEYPAVVCDACKWCSVPGCPIQGSVVTALETHPKVPVLAIPKAIENSVDAANAMLFVGFAEGIVDQVKDLLRGYVEANGPVEAGGKVAELRANDPWKCTNVEGAAKIMAAYGIPSADIWGSLTLSEGAVEKLFKRHKMSERLAMILAQGERKQYGPRFGIYNAKSNDIV